MDEQRTKTAKTLVLNWPDGGPDVALVSRELLQDLVNRANVGQHRLG